MKLFLGIWVGVIILGWGFLFAVSLFSGSLAPLLLVTLIIAALITGLVSLSEEVDQLSRRVKALEDATAPKEEPVPAEPGITKEN